MLLGDRSGIHTKKFYHEISDSLGSEPLRTAPKACFGFGWFELSGLNSCKPHGRRLVEQEPCAERKGEMLFGDRSGINAKKFNNGISDSWGFGPCSQRPRWALALDGSSFLV